MGLAHPARGQFSNVDYLQASGRRCGSDFFHDRTGLVGGPIVYRDDFIIVVVEGEQAIQCRFNIGCFVARGNDDAELGMARRRAVPFGA